MGEFFYFIKTVFWLFKKIGHNFLWTNTFLWVNIYSLNFNEKKKDGVIELVL